MTQFGLVFLLGSMGWFFGSVKLSRKDSNVFIFRREVRHSPLPLHAASNVTFLLLHTYALKQSENIMDR